MIVLLDYKISDFIKNPHLFNINVELRKSEYYSNLCMELSGGNINGNIPNLQLRIIALYNWPEINKIIQDTLNSIDTIIKTFPRVFINRYKIQQIDGDI